MTGNYTYFCPNCSGKNIKPAHDSLFRMGREMEMFFCDDCNYLGPLVVAKDGRINPEMKKDLKRITT